MLSATSTSSGVTIPAGQFKRIFPDPDSVVNATTLFNLNWEVSLTTSAPVRLLWSQVYRALKRETPQPATSLLTLTLVGMIRTTLHTAEMLLGYTKLDCQLM